MAETLVVKSGVMSLNLDTSGYSRVVSYICIYILTFCLLIT